MSIKYRLKKTGLLFLLLCLLAGAFAGCSDNSSKDDAEENAATSVTPSGSGGQTVSGTEDSVYASMTVDTDLTVGQWDDGSGFADMEETAIVLSDSGAEISGSGAAVEGSRVTISAEGVYRVSGSCSEGQLYVNVGDDEHVRLILDGVTLSSSNGAPIYVENAKKVLLTLADGSENRITDTTPDGSDTESGSSGTAESASETTEDNASEAPAPAGIYSRDDLTIGGTGTLTVEGNTNGIVTKDKLKILSGTLHITAGNNGVRGNECLAVYDGSITVTAGNDGIKSYTSNEATCGFVTVRGGSVTVVASGDGIHGEYMVDVRGGELDITTGGGSAAAPAHTSDFEHGGWGFGSSSTETADSVSQKGIKSDYQIFLSDGSAVIDSADDSVHSNGTVVLSGGKWTLSTGDDGIHADSSLTVSGGVYDIQKSYEGLESVVITVSGGEGTIAASDDGINCNSDDSFYGGMGFDAVSASTMLTITGGSLTVLADGDGLDSNGNVSMSGGYVVVNGPTNNGNGALDYAGSFQMTGGTLIAAGSSGMAQSVTPSGCYALMITWPSMLSAGTEVRLTDDSGTEIFSFAPEKTYNSIVICTPDLTAADYVLYSGSEKQCEFTISGELTSISSDGSAYSGGMGMGNGGMRPGGGRGGDGTAPGGGRDDNGTAPDMGRDDGTAPGEGRDNDGTAPDTGRNSDETAPDTGRDGNGNETPPEGEPAL
ncbi:MAG: carbohydrate-binding domain-containing protein [Lachnospiraceae bacterium]|nr:carbohydrate-binding domain-containing protein [Lachnospiraceae bacterium]